MCPTTTLTKTEHEWKPIRNGQLYCSPACGWNCTHAAWKAAKDESARIAKLLGPGWKPRVRENCGWRWEVKFGPITCYPPSGPAGLYEVGYEKTYAVRTGSPSVTGASATLQMQTYHKNPCRAVADLLAKIEGFALDMLDASGQAWGSLRSKK